VKRNVVNTESTTGGDEKEKRVKTNKGAYLERNDKSHVTGKRQYDRQSGTGRGKEISKGGAGGKFTWGNYAKNVPKDAGYANEDYYNEDDRYFNSALNKPKTDETKENKPEEKLPEKEKEVVVEKVEEPVADPVEVFEENKDWNDKRKKKKGAVEEEKVEMLVRPENALSLSEYKDQLKLKNQNIVKTNVEVKRPDEGIELKPETKNENEFQLGLTDEKKKTAPKQKAKNVTVDPSEKHLSQAIAFKTEEEGYVRRDNKNYDQGKGYQGKKKGGNNFKYNPDDFPEL